MEKTKANVFETYNIIADWFFENRQKGLMEKTYLDRVIDSIGKSGTVLDLGCGTGIPMMAYLLNQGINTTGVDASYRMLEIAKKNLPTAQFIQADMRQLSLNRKFDAIIAWHSFFHLPLEDQPSMFSVFKAHLNNNGLLLFTSGKTHGEAWGINGGENLFHASLDNSEYKELLEKHHFRLLSYKEDDPEIGNVTWLAQFIDRKDR